MKTFLLMLFSLHLLGCGAGDGTGLDQNGQPLDPDGTPTTPQPPNPPDDPNAIQPNLTSIQEKVLTPVCVQCHAGVNAPAGLRMDDLDTSIANLINIDSSTNPAFKRVEPQNPDQSFFYLKIVGDPVAGNQMPLGQTPLSSDTQQVIREWIEVGAPTSANQLTVASKRQVDPDLGLSVTLTFSQPLLRGSLQSEDIQLSAKREEVEWPIPNNKKRFTWVAPNKVQISVSKTLNTADTIVLRLSQPSISTIISQSGVALESNLEGNKEGEVRYEYSIN